MSMKSVTVTRDELEYAGYNMMNLVRDRLLDAGCPLHANGTVFSQEEVFTTWSIDGDALTFMWEERPHAERTD